MMSERSKNLHAEVIEAAGGLLWRTTQQGKQIAVVHRPNYDDWTLPKGKRDPGESWQLTALREIKEETGCIAQLDAFAGSTAYSVGDTAKVVLFWHMNLFEECQFRPNSEVDELQWLSAEEALQKLDYENERKLLRAQSA
jgi:8-oxo-dGTP pyrophosphatase MutT (NUDIX family)